MSCGNPHAVPCTQVLSLVYVYIDDEIDEVQRLEITTHLGECPPCVEQFTIERRIRERVRSACGCEVDAEVRSRLTARIRSVTMRSDTGMRTDD